MNKATMLTKELQLNEAKKFTAGKSVCLDDIRAGPSSCKTNQILDDIESTPTKENSDIEFSESEENENSESDENCDFEQSETKQTETEDLKVPVTKICDIVQGSFVIVSFVYNSSTKKKMLTVLCSKINC